MARTTWMVFQRKFSDLLRRAQRGPVEITRRGRRALVLMSADHYDWLVAAARRTHRTMEAAPVVADAVRRAEMDPEAHGAAVRQQPLTPLKGSGRGFWGTDSTRTLRRLRDQWSR